MAKIMVPLHYYGPRNGAERLAHHQRMLDAAAPGHGFRPDHMARLLVDVGDADPRLIAPVESGRSKHKRVAKKLFSAKHEKDPAVIAGRAYREQQMHRLHREEALLYGRHI